MTKIQLKTDNITPFGGIYSFFVYTQIIRAKTKNVSFANAI